MGGILLTQDLTLQTDNGKLNIRVAAWIEHEEQLLMCEFPDGTISLPGGRMQFGETSEEAVKREIFEETGEQITDVKLIAVIENFFHYNQPFHELLFVYRGSLPIKVSYSGIDFGSQKIHWLPKSNADQLKPAVLAKLEQLPHTEIHQLMDIV